MQKECKKLSKEECLPPDCTYVETSKRKFCRTKQNRKKQKDSKKSQTVKIKRNKDKKYKPIYIFKTQIKPQSHEQLPKTLAKVESKSKSASQLFPIKESKIIKDRTDISACVQEDKLQEEIKEKRENKKQYKKECDKEIFSFITQYFNKDKSRIKDLVRALYNLYKNKQKEDQDYKLSLEEFILMFPRDTSTGNFNFRRQHVFEGLCLYILLKNYDNDYWGEKKEFYDSLEKYVKGNTEKLSDIDIIKKQINDGSSAQSVDIFFKIPKKSVSEKEKKEIDSQPACNVFPIKKEKKDTQIKDLFVLIQNKFYDQEKSSADKYDVLKIASRSKELKNERFEEVDKKIVLMVNSKEKLDKKITQNRNKDFNLVDEIFGLKQLDAWFQNMLYDIYKSNNFKEFIRISSNDKPSLQPRFHQEIFIESTNEYLNNKDKTKQHKKFIWGAVPRSGKSYMIAGMIHKRNMLDSDGSNNDILIVLGAKTETEKQFYDMFNEFDNFKDYGIIKVSDGKKANAEKSKNIYITSQQKGKINIEDYEKYTNLFKKKKIDIYFDEIHHGGSSKKSQEIINFFIDKHKFIVDLFVMVTATYAKPKIAYNSILDNKPPMILNWSYEDQQLMKQITNETKYNQFILSRNDDIQKKVIEDLFVEYKIKYGSDYLNILEDEYKKHPELVIIQPFIDIAVSKEQEPELFNIHGNLFKLKCDAISGDIDILRDPTKIFKDNTAIQKLIQFIGKEDIKHDTKSSVLSEHCIYGKLEKKYNYNVRDIKHSELWFLPDKFLYDNPELCRQELIEKDVKLKMSYDDEGIINQYDADDKQQKNEKNSLPNIEPLTRGLVLNLLQSDFFRDNYCFLIVHGQKIQYIKGKKKEKDLTSKVFEDYCVKLHSEDDDDLKDKILQFEKQTFQENKSLIILTGSSLRLGVSLPCADIAFNFDGVQSIDLNYQTMFRVLTERKGKKYGYYFDFYPERAITFLYDYNDYYSNTSKTMDSGTQIQDIQSLLYLFNYNGLSLSSSTKTTEDTLKLYNTLIDKLKINENEMTSRYISNIKSRFEKLLDSLGQIEVLTDFAKYQMNKEGITKIAEKVRKGKKKEVAKTKPEKQDDELSISDLKQDDEEIEEDITPDTKQIAEFLSTYIPLISLFSKENKCASETSTFVDCINNMITDISNNVSDEEGSLKKYCLENCSTNIEPLACYMNLISDYDKKTFLKSLNLLKDLYTNEKYNKDEKIQKLLRIINNIYVSIREKMGKKTNLIYDMTPNEIQEKIEEYLPVKKAEKDKYGEVFTPAELIDEMLEKLPSSVWKNPNYKWLDPANGIGNFPMKVFERLNEELSSVYGYKDEAKRKQHIIKNMLYMVELNPKNVAVSRKIFGKDANIYCGSFLEDGWKDEFKIDKFDVIIGNPPYNEGKTGRSGLKNLDEIFTIKSLEHLKDNKYLLFIIKTTIRGLTSKGYNSIIDKQILYSKVFDFKNNPFNENVLTNYLLIQNCKNTKKTTFEYNNKIESGYVQKGLNIYFLPLKFSNSLIRDIKQYGNLEKITRGLKENAKNYLLVRHSTPDIKISKVKPTGDKYYIIPNPSIKMITFFREKYPIMRKYGLFNGFSTPKSLFLNIPNYNNSKSITRKSTSKSKSKGKKTIKKVKSLPNKHKKTIKSKSKKSSKKTRRIQSI